MSRSSQWLLSSGFPTAPLPVCTLFLPMPCTFHPPLLDHFKFTRGRLLFMKLLIVEFSSDLPSLHPFSVEIFSSASCSQTPSSLCSFLNASDQVSHTYEAIGKNYTVLLNILIFKFSISKSIVLYLK
jgi:hypothetical protein